MAKAKTVKKRKKTVAPKKQVVQEQQLPPEEQPLTQEQMAQLMVDLDTFQHKFLSILAMSDKFEIVPTADDDGNILSQEQLSLIKRELNRLGLATVYTFNVGTRFTVLMCPSKDSKLKIGMVSNGAEVH